MAFHWGGWAGRSEVRLPWSVQRGGCSASLPSSPPFRGLGCSVVVPCCCFGGFLFGWVVCFFRGWGLLGLVLPLFPVPLFPGSASGHARPSAEKKKRRTTTNPEALKPQACTCIPRARHRSTLEPHPPQIPLTKNDAPAKNPLAASILLRKETATNKNKKNKHHPNICFGAVSC